MFQRLVPEMMRLDGCSAAYLMAMRTLSEIRMSSQNLHL